MHSNEEFGIPELIFDCNGAMLCKRFSSEFSELTTCSDSNSVQAGKPGEKGGGGEGGRKGAYVSLWIT